jgi:hypothetical protein
VFWAFAGWERGQSVADLVVAIAGRWLPALLALLAYLLARYSIGAVADLSALLVWLPVAYLALLLLVFAPYKVWKEEHKRAAAAEERLRVRLSIHAVVRQVGGGKMASLIVENLGLGHIANCTGELKAVYEWVDGKFERRPDVHPLYLRWSRRYQSDDSPNLTFNRTAELEVVHVPEVYSGLVEVMPFQRQPHPPFHTAGGNFWLPEKARYVFEVEVSAENCVPVRIDCWLSLQPLGRHATRGPGGTYNAVPLPDLTFVVRPEAERREAERHPVASERGA